MIKYCRGRQSVAARLSSKSTAKGGEAGAKLANITATERRQHLAHLPGDTAGKQRRRFRRRSEISVTSELIGAGTVVAELRREQGEIHVIGKADGTASFLHGGAQEGNEGWIPAIGPFLRACDFTAIHSTYPSTRSTILACSRRTVETN